MQPVNIYLFLSIKNVYDFIVESIELLNSKQW